MSGSPLLKVKDLRKNFAVHGGSGGLFRKDLVRAVDGVDLEIMGGETFGLVGESGCGKTTLGRCILLLIPITSGRVFFDSKDMALLSGRQMRAIRKDMQIIFQDPFSSLDPRMRVGRIVGQPFNVFKVKGRGSRQERVAKLLTAVGLEPDCVNRFPHEFSGGQRQRIAIARSLALRPRFIVADEPVSALDVSVRAQVLNLLKELKERLGLTYLYISHDLSTVKFISDRVAVMYLGKIVETGPVGRVFENPLHPYTRSLIEAVPIPNPLKRKARERMKGEPPSPLNPPEGCRFHPRCPEAQGICSRTSPEWMEVEPGHRVFCHLFGG